MSNNQSPSTENINTADSDQLFYQRSFSGLERLYGENALTVFSQTHAMVIGIGGVGSWAAESLARTAIGEITLIDLDNISISNINRQLPALSNTIGMAKVDVMKSRILAINPICKVNVIEDFITNDNIQDYINNTTDVVIDCIDQVNEKAAIAAYCKRNKIKLVVTGGAGGKTDITQITSSDLGKTYHDPLLAKMRSKLKQNHQLVPNKKGRFDIACVFSSEQSKYIDASGNITQQKPKDTTNSGLNCHHGMGSLMAMTASLGLAATSLVFTKLMAKKS